MSNLLRVERVRRGWTQERAARQAGLSFYAYRRIEVGLSQPTVAQRRAIARAFKVTPDALWGAAA